MVNKKQFLVLFIKFVLLIIIIGSPKKIYGQSIHQEQQNYYNKLGKLTTNQYDLLSGFKLLPKKKTEKSCVLEKMVYGWFPYWGGSTYQNFQWDLLSDLVYFSYEVNAATGGALDTHGWSSAPSVNEALNNGRRVSLCITLFSNHATLYNNPTATNKLITDAVAMVKSRGGHGINIDFEAVSSADRDKFTTFANQLADHLHAEIPGSILTIAMPAVEWSDKFDVVTLRAKVDYFVIMGYDYYWSGGSTAGPGDGLYSMEASYNRNLNRSISDWVAKGIPENQLLLGLPYYGREWGTADNNVPSATVGGSANSSSKFYKVIQDNATGYYSSANKKFNANSFSSYYVFHNGTEWRQCWVDDATDLGRRMDLINYRNLAGMGIWALGYDDGYTELWDEIRNNFSSCATQASTDSIYDSGGPAFNYYANEDYTFTISPEGNNNFSINFTEFSLENNDDYLYIYDGFGTNNLIGQYTGSNSPGIVNSTSGAITIRATTDGSTSSAGWKAIWTSQSEQIIDDFEINVGHFYSSPTFSGSTVGIDASSSAQRVTTDAKNGIASLAVELIDNSSLTDNWSVRLLSGAGTPANNTPFTVNGSFGFWMKTSTAQTDAKVKLWIDDTDGLEETEAIAVINDGNWNYYAWDLATVSGQTITTGNGVLDGPGLTLDAIVFEQSNTSTTWMTYLDDVKFSDCNSFSNITVTECDSYTAPDNQSYTTSGFYTAIIPNSAGCDSTINIDLTINKSTSSTLTETITNGSYTSPSGKLWTSSGVYNDTIPNAVGCDSVITITLYFTTSLIDLEANELFHIYPNPIKDEMNIQFEETFTGIVEILNMSGSILFSKEVKQQKLMKIKTNMLNPGIYLIKINNSKINLVQKVLKR